MPNRKPETSDRARLLAKALSRWDTEGGAGDGGRVQPVAGVQLSDALPLTNAELAHLQVRVIALENLLKVLLIDLSEDQAKLMRDLAAFISPQPGFTQHPLTIQAAACMINLVDSAGHLRDLQLVAVNIEEASP